MIITSLFSIFDPSLTTFSISWVVILLVLIILPSLFWGGNELSFFFNSLINYFKTEMGYLISSPVKGTHSLIPTLFVTLGLYNFIALFPYWFSVTSHILVTLPFSVTFWIGLLFFGWVRSFTHFLAHLIPVGTPLVLMGFMVVVETVSNFIRPLALTFRLTANMMAGHLLISLIGGALIKLSFSILLFGCVFHSLLTFIELGVSLVQAYVFVTLLLIYLVERM